MQTFPDEKVLMTSDDNSITLTTHRIFQRNAEVSKEILLKHVVTHQVIKRKMLYYKILTSFFLFITLLGSLGLQSINDEGLVFLTWLFIVLTLTSVFFLFRVRNSYLKIISHFGDIEFSLSKMNESSLNQFLNRMYDEIEKRKKDNG